MFVFSAKNEMRPVEGEGNLGRERGRRCQIIENGKWLYWETYWMGTTLLDAFEIHDHTFDTSLGSIQVCDILQQWPAVRLQVQSM